MRSLCICLWSLLAALLCPAILAAAGPNRHALLTDTTLAKHSHVDFPLDPFAGEITAEVMASATDNRNSHTHSKDGSQTGWGVELLKNGHIALRVAVGWGNTDFGGSFDERFLRITVDSVAPDGHDVRLLTRDLVRDVNLFTGPNELAVEISRGQTAIYIGKDTEIYCGSVGTELGHPFAPLQSVALRLYALSPLKVDYLTLRQKPNPAFALLPSSKPTVTPADSREGLYRFMDRDTDARYALLGGRYTLRVQRSADLAGYELVYEGGAETNRALWRKGMLKGRLDPTEFRDHYRLTWYDAEGEEMGTEAWGDFQTGDVLTLSLPLWKATLRFVRQ